MKANELRIGNWVYPNDENNTPYQVVGIDNVEMVDFGLSRFNGRTKILASTLQPIPLTAEILEKAGFYQLPHFTIQNNWIKALGRNRFLTVASVGTPNEIIFLTEEEAPEVKSVIVLRNYDYDGKTYLHIIQNIYQICTGQELEIEL